MLNVKIYGSCLKIPRFKRDIHGDIPSFTGFIPRSSMVLVYESLQHWVIEMGFLCRDSYTSTMDDLGLGFPRKMIKPCPQRPEMNWELTSLATESMGRWLEIMTWNVSFNKLYLWFHLKVGVILNILPSFGMLMISQWILGQHVGNITCTWNSKHEYKKTRLFYPTTWKWSSTIIHNHPVLTYINLY